MWPTSAFFICLQSCIPVECFFFVNAVVMGTREIAEACLREQFGIIFEILTLVLALVFNKAVQVYAFSLLLSPFISFCLLSSPFLALPLPTTISYMLCGWCLTWFVNGSSKYNAERKTYICVMCACKVKGSNIPMLILTNVEGFLIAEENLKLCP